MKCMGDFGALSPEERTRLRNREPAMIEPVKNIQTIYYSEPYDSQKKSSNLVASKGRNNQRLKEINKSKSQNSIPKSMNGNYYMGDFGSNGSEQEMGFKIKLPKIKMPEIRIGKKMQAEILKPIATVGKVVAPAAILIPGIGPAVAAGISAGAASVSALATQLASKAEYDLAMDKAKKQQAEINKQIIAEQEKAVLQEQVNQQIQNAQSQQKKSNITAGIMGVGAAAALGAFFLMKD
jgi:actin-related protein